MVQFRNAHGGVAGQGLEALPVGRQQPVVEVRRDALQSPGHRGALVPPHHQTAHLFAKVNEEIGVAHHRQVPGDAAEMRRDEVLVLHRGDGDRHPHHAADLPRPDAGRADDHGGADGALGSDDGVDPSVADDDICRRRLGVNLAAAATRGVRQSVGEPAGVDAAVAGNIGRPDQIAIAHDRKQPEGFTRTDEFQFQAVGLSQRRLPAQFFHPPLAAGQAQAAHATPVRIETGLLPQPRVQLDAVHDHPGEVVRSAELTD